MTPIFQTSRARFLALAALAVIVASCGKGQQAIPKVDAKPVPVPVAIVNGNKLSRDEYDFYTKSLTQGKGAETLTPEQKGQVLDGLIDMEIMSEQALKDGVENDPSIAARLHIARLHLLEEAESEKYLKGKDATDAELHAEYDTAVAKLDKTEYHARHILVKDKALAEQLTKKLKAGAKFEDLAKANSIDTQSKVNGGDLGWFQPGRMVAPFADAVKGLKKGELTPEPVQTQYGWHIIQLEDTRESAPPPFDQVKDQVRKIVMQKKWQAYVDELKKGAQIEKKL